MRNNTCNAGKGEGFQVQSGEIAGFSRAKTEGAAFRKLIGKRKNPAFGKLARFRMIQFLKGGYNIITPWLYQDNDSLRNTK